MRVSISVEIWLMLRFDPWRPLLQACCWNSGSGGLVSELIDDVEQRLALEIGIKRQRPVGPAVPALEPGRHPGVAVGQAPGQDRLRAHDIDDRAEELIRERRDH